VDWGGCSKVGCNPEWEMGNEAFGNRRQVGTRNAWFHAHSEAKPSRTAAGLRQGMRVLVFKRSGRIFSAYETARSPIPWH